MTRQIRSNDYVPVLDICRQLYDVLLRRRAPRLQIKMQVHSDPVTSVLSFVIYHDCRPVSSDFDGTHSQHPIIQNWGESRIWGGIGDLG